MVLATLIRASAKPLGSVFTMAVLMATASAQIPLGTWRGDALADFFGTAVGGGGDVDGDQLPDFVIGAVEVFPAALGRGYARVISARSLAPLFTWSGDALGDEFGSALTIVGDVDGDGYDDVLVGAPKADPSGASSGFARLFSGRSGAVLRTHAGLVAGELLGSSVCSAGDVDGDGAVDYAIGSPRTAALPGKAELISGRTGSTIRTLIGTSNGDRLGSALANAGDFNHDGSLDLALGIPGSDSAGVDFGSILVVSGATGATLRAFHGVTTNSNFGASLDAGLDVNADGWTDVLAGAWRDHGGVPGLEPGRVRLFSGVDGSLLHEEIGFTGDDYRGRALALLGDVDGDGFGDFGVFGRHDFDVQHPGVIFVRSGRTFATLMTLYGDRDQDAFGQGLARVGDVDGDGLADVLGGATEGYHAAPEQGYARLFRGAPGRIETYGASCAGAGGAFMHVRVEATPGPGAAARILVTGGPPNRVAIMRFGRQRAQFVWRASAASSSCVPGITDLLDLALPIPLNGAGAGERVLALPLDPVTLSKLDLQVFARDPLSPSRLRATSPIEVGLR